jgi:hypothetical protein
MTTALLDELLDFCCMAISASNTELRILFDDKFHPKEIPDDVRGAPALREYYISCLLEESDIILNNKEIVDCIESVIKKYRYKNQGFASLPDDISDLTLGFVSDMNKASRRHYDTGKQQSKFRAINEIVVGLNEEERKRVKFAILTGRLTPDIIAKLPREMLLYLINFIKLREE